jgi:hypothetical protein
MHHPWRAFRELAHIRLRWAVLPSGLLGYTDHEAGEVVLAEGLTQAERRCTIAHEVQHVLRGPVPPYLKAREEQAVDRAAARLLLPDVRVIADAMVWAHSLEEAADELWVDPAMLRCRLASLHPAERAYLRRRQDGGVNN